MPHSTQLGQHEVTFEDVGSDEGPPILLTPGAGDDAAALRERFAPFGAVYRLITWDPPAVTEEPPREYAQLAFELLHQRGIERAIFAGDGLGALVSLRAGLSGPDRVRGVILFDLPDGDAPEYDRIAELDLPAVVFQTEVEAARGHDDLEPLTAQLRDNRGVHLLDGAVRAADPDRADVVDPLLRDYLESLPA